MDSIYLFTACRWDINLGTIAESVLKDLYPRCADIFNDIENKTYRPTNSVDEKGLITNYYGCSMPVIHIRAVTQDKQENRNTYECPIYKTRQRGGAEVQYNCELLCFI